LTLRSYWGRCYLHSRQGAQPERISRGRYTRQEIAYIFDTNGEWAEGDITRKCYYFESFTSISYRSGVMPRAS
jgi:hypothetical protein